MYASAHGATVAAEGLSQIGQGPATYLLIGAAAATILGGLLLAVCVCAGGLAGAAAWYLGQQPLPAPPRASEAAALADLAELATQVLLGGQAAQDTVARRLQVAPEVVEAWANDWARAAEGPSGLHRRRQPQSHRAPRRSNH